MHYTPKLNAHFCDFRRGALFKISGYEAQAHVTGDQVMRPMIRLPGKYQVMRPRLRLPGNQVKGALPAQHSAQNPESADNVDLAPPRNRFQAGVHKI